jgi:hypothetical protein
MCLLRDNLTSMSVAFRYTVMHSITARIPDVCDRDLHEKCAGKNVEQQTLNHDMT